MQDLNREELRGYLDGDTKLENLSPEQLSRHVEANQHSAESLLAAFQSSGDIAWLTNAAALHPDDPRVQFAMVVHGGDQVNRREWLDRLKTSDPANALANYLSAKEHFRAGKTEDAIKDLLAGASKAGFNDYSMHDVQSAEEMYLAAGESPVESKLRAQIQERLPHLQELRKLPHELVKLQEQAAARGDAKTYHDLAQIGMQLGRTIGDSQGMRFLLNDAVGISIQKQMLNTLQPDVEYPFLRATPAEVLADLDSRMQSIRDASRSAGDIADANPNDLLTYFDRTKVHGELNALEWLANKQAAARP